MKKSKLIILLTTFLLSGCCYAIEKNSINEYKEKIAINDFGFSEIELDKPQYFLPSNTFLDDFKFHEGEYYFYEPCVFNELCSDYCEPIKVLLVLKYDESEYLKAKEYTNENIPKYKEYFYVYNDYQFYINKNFMDRYKNISIPEIPNIFTMVGYNDQYNIICFLGYAKTYNEMDEKYINNFDENFTSFIDQYYGEYYDFSK